MKVLLVHLSDIHLKRENNVCLGRKEQICKSFQNIALGADKVFIVITGDIAFSGSEYEYIKAKELLDFISHAIQMYSKKQVEFVIVPGNHDCRFDSDNEEIRKIIVRDIQTSACTNVSDSVIDHCCEVQRNFRSFAESYNNNIAYSDNLFSVIRHEFNGYSIVFYCYNTAWLSEEEEKVGKLCFPIKRLSTEYYDTNANLSISLLHHPFAWHNPQSAKALSDYLEDTSQLILTGHSHVPSKSIKDNLEGKLTEYVEGSILQCEDNGDEQSGFNMIEIDLDRKTQRICQFEWNSDIYSVIKDTGELAFGQLMRKYRDVFELDPVFDRGFLDDTGAQFRHPRKADLTMQDIFIFPHIRDVSTAQERGKFIYHDVKESEILLSTQKVRNKILLLGSEKSGKTALCKILYKSYYKQGYIPIYIRGEDIGSPYLERFNKLLRRCYQEQYSNQTPEKFDQLENNKKFLIIDDYDKLKLNLKYRSMLLNNINQYYPNILITGNDLYQIGELVAEAEQDTSPLKGYMEYSIMPFGNLLRQRLIEKWNILGREEYIEEAEVIRSNNETKKIIDTIIGKNLVPSYPIFLLTILQGIEIGHPHYLEESSYGYCYQLLIGQDITRVAKSNDKINAYYNYLTELSYFMFKNNVREISVESLSQFHKWYCNEYKVSQRFSELVNLGILVDNLIDARMITKVGEIYRFRYNYIYYFFIAKYFADNLTSGDIKDTLTEMGRRLYVEDFANTIMFLTHHSKDPFILDVVLANTRKVFPKYTIIRFEEDVAPINNILTEIPKLVLQEHNLRDVRDKIAIRKDKIEMEEEEIEEHNDLDIRQEIVGLDFISELNLTFRLLEILGQILKNYHGSLKGDLRFSICEEEYLLGLRSLESFFKLLQTHPDYLVNRIKSFTDFTEKKGRVSLSVIEQAARRTLFGLCLFISFGFIKKVSDSVGSEYLSETYREVLEKQNVTSVHLVDLSIKLDFYKGFPCNDIKLLKKKLEYNILAYSILRELVMDYLYMYPTDFKVKQRITSLINISMQEQRLLDIASTDKLTSD